MLDTSSRANFKPTAEIDDLDVLAKAVREHLQASANAAQNFLEHTLDAGDALIRAKAQVDALVWWSSASPEARSRFIDGVGLKPLIAAIPPSWRREAEQAVGPVSPRVTTLLQLALSTTSAGEAFNALAAVKRVLAANGYDLHDVEIRLNNQNHRFGRAA
jgi:hypothetical protein